MSTYDLIARISALEAEREFCLRATKAAGEKHTAQLAAVTAELTEAQAREVKNLELFFKENSEKLRLIKERDEARANAWHINKDREGFIAENARLRTELDTAREWADGRVASAYAERDEAREEAATWKAAAHNDAELYGEAQAENARLRAAIAPTPENVAFLVREFAGISSAFAARFLAAIAARAGVKL